MNPEAAALLLALAVTLHNAEEMVWLPGFAHPPSLKLDVPPVAFRFAATMIAVVFWLAALALSAGWQVEAVVAGFALAMIFNAVLPHLALSLALRRYHPGTATAWLLVVPAAVAYLTSVDASARLADPTLLALAFAGFAGLAAAVPLLLAFGRRLERHLRH